MSTAYARLMRRACQVADIPMRCLKGVRLARRDLRAAPVGSRPGTYNRPTMQTTNTPLPKSRLQMEFELPPERLSRAVNQAVGRLSRQTRALDRARIDAETRTGFIETVLSGVEAGVIRIDAELKVTIANASAQTLLGFRHPVQSPTCPVVRETCFPSEAENPFSRRIASANW